MKTVRPKNPYLNHENEEMEEHLELDHDNKPKLMRLSTRLQDDLKEAQDEKDGIPSLNNSRFWFANARLKAEQSKLNNWERPHHK